MNKSTFALALGTFSLGISEFLMMGILVPIATSLGVSVADAGHLISAYATGVCVGAVAMLLLRRMRLSLMLMVLAALIAAGNLLAAVAPGFWSMLAARFISGLPHGAYFGVGAIVARKLAAPGHEARQVSYMIAGMTVATLVGVPLGTFISDNFSWRIAFVLVAFTGTLTFLLIHLWVPRIEPLPDNGFKGQFRFLRTLAPWMIFGGVLFSQIGLYCWYSYIDPQLTVIAGFAPADLTWLMVLAGAGMFCGNLVGGKLSDRFRPSAVSLSIMIAAMVIMTLYYFFGDIRWAAALLMFLGTATLFGSSSPMQSSIVGYSRGGELLGGACIQIAYNAGNAIAAFIGGCVIRATHSYHDVPLPGIPIIALGAVMMLILYLRIERHQSR